MKKITATTLTICMTISLFSGCHDSKVICLDNKGQECYEFQPYGIADDEKRNDNVQYSVSVGNIIWSVILIETIFVPIILMGWYLYEPEGKKIPGIPGAM